MHFLRFHQTPSYYSAKWMNRLGVDYISGNALKTKQSRKTNQWAVSKRRGTKAKQRPVGSNRTLFTPPHPPPSTVTTAEILFGLVSWASGQWPMHTCPPSASPVRANAFLVIAAQERSDQVCAQDWT